MVGPNGEGKTNLLEAMYYLCALESPRVRSDLPLVRSGAGAAVLRGEIETGHRRLLVEVEIRASGQNRVMVNRSPVRRRADLRRLARAVFSGPDDLAVVEGDPAERRRFMDEAVRVLSPVEEGAVGAYDRVLRQRNRLLKDWDGQGEPAGLAAWDDQLVERGSALTRARAEAVAGIAGRASKEFLTLSGEELQVEYRPSVAGEPLEDLFRQALHARRRDELIRRSSLVGPHRDELALAVRGLTARGFASHGEAWGAALCLRLALAAATSERTAEDPLTLLDDPFSALDPQRRSRVAANLGRWEQVLIAVPDQAQAPEGATVWRVKEGRVAVE